MSLSSDPLGQSPGQQRLKQAGEAKVWLAMRDTSKAITEIPEDIERSGKFERIQADLTDSKSIAEAVKKSGAKAAYLYLIFGTPDYMRGSLRALRDGGVEHVVCLSSMAVGEDPRSVTPDNFIGYTHAQVELALEEIGFPYITALRPGSFASNYLTFLDKSTKPPRANIAYGDALVDNIVPNGIGAVGGAVLVERPSDSRVIYLCGPEKLTLEHSWAIIKSVTGRDDIDTTPLGPDEWLSRMTQHTPLPVAKEILRHQDEMRNPEASLSGPKYEKAVANIQRYFGKAPTKFEDYIEAHKKEWQAV